MKKWIIVLTLVLSLSLVVGEVRAEEGEETFSLEEIVVTASKYEEELSETSVSGAVIDQEDISNKNAYNAADLLKDITGVQINDYSGVTGVKTISMRGSQPEQVLVLIDGQPMNSRQSGQIDLSRLNIEQIEKIEVLRGPASAIYGANALGGVVNIITKSGTDESSTNVKMGYGSFNTQQYSLTQQGGEDKLNYNLAVTAKKSDGHRDIPDNSDLEQYNLFTKFDYQLTKYSDLILSLRYNDSDKGVPGEITNPTPNAQQNDEDKNINLTWKQQREDTDTKVLAYYNQHEQSYYDKYYSNQDNPADFNNYYRDQDGDVYYYDGSKRKEVNDINLTEKITNSIHDTNRMGLDFSRTKYYQEHTLSYGTTVKQNEIDSNENGEHETLNKALFVQDKWAVNEVLTVNLGSRYDDHDKFGSEISPRAGLVYKVDQNLKLHLSGGQAYRTPTFNDLYWPASAYTEGNPDLKPETAVAYEVGSTYLTDQSKIKVSLFQRDVDDLIDWAQGDDGVYRPDNVNQAEISGIELTAKRELNEKITAGFNYTYLDAVNTTAGERLEYRPYHKANLDLNYRADKFATAVNAKLVDGRTGDLASYFVLDGKVSKDYQINDAQFKLSLEVNNLLDRDYEVRAGYPMAERNYMMTVTTEF